MSSQSESNRQMTYSVQQLHRCDGTDENCSEASEASFDKDQV